MFLIIIDSHCQKLKKEDLIYLFPVYYSDDILQIYSTTLNPEYWYWYNPPIVFSTPQGHKCLGLCAYIYAYACVCV